MSKKEIKPSVSSDLANAILKILEVKCSGPDSISTDIVVRELKKSREFGIKNVALLRLMVNQAITEKLVPGFAAMRGRPPSGGIYSIERREDWNKQVDAGLV